MSHGSNRKPDWPTAQQRAYNECNTSSVQYHRCLMDDPPCPNSIWSHRADQGLCAIPQNHHTPSRAARTDVNTTEALVLTPRGAIDLCWPLWTRVPTSDEYSCTCWKCVNWAVWVDFYPCSNLSPITELEWGGINSVTLCYQTCFLCSCSVADINCPCLPYSLMSSIPV